MEFTFGIEARDMLIWLYFSVKLQFFIISCNDTNKASSSTDSFTQETQIQKYVTIERNNNSTLPIVKLLYRSGSTLITRQVGEIEQKSIFQPSLLFICCNETPDSICKGFVHFVHLILQFFLQMTHLRGGIAAG